MTDIIEILRSGNIDEQAATAFEAADEITALRERVASANEIFAELIGSLTQHGRNRDTMLSINHDALRSIVAKARDHLLTPESDNAES